MKVLNFGSCNIDYVYKLHHIVTPGETEHSASLGIYAGGKGLNQSIAMARAGVAICHAGCIGTDGTLLTDTMRESGVDVSNVRMIHEKTGHAIIEVSEKGENAIIVYAGANACLSKEFIDDVLARFSESDFLVLQNETSNTDYIIESAYARGMRIIFNPSPVSDALIEVNFDHVSYLILNEVEAKAISGSDVPEKILSYMKEKHPNTRVLLTLGEKGSIYRDEAETHYQSAFAVEALDTTAAGDTFTGYFVSALCRALPVKEALREASAASALAVSRVGASPSIPYLDEVHEALKALRERESEESAQVRLKRRIEAYAESEYATASLSSLAELLGYSAPYTGELVQKLTGRTFSALLHDKRCAVAAKQLAETDLPVREIIYGVGYTNESYFRKLFREIYGKGPFEYRKIVKKS